MSPESSRIPRIAIALGAVVVVLAGVGGLLAINGGDDDDGPDGNGRRSTTTESTTATTTTTEPAAVGDDQELAFSIIEERVLEGTQVTDRLLQNPQVVNDPADPDIARLRELYTSDSTTPASVISRLQELASGGQTVRAGPSGVFREVLVRQMEADDENTVRFGFCAVEDQETVDGTGAVVEHFIELTQGAGRARRENNEWRIEGIDRHEDISFPLDPGAQLEGFCLGLYPEGEATS